MLNKLKKIYRRIHFWIFCVLNAKSDYKVSIITKLNYALKGFTVNEYIWYDLKHNDYKSYISDYERLNSREINGEYTLILDNKLLFEEVFGNYIKVPKNYAWYSNGKIYGLHEYKLSKENIVSFLKEKEILVMKWEKGNEGKGVNVLKYINNNFIINDCLVNEEEILKLFDCKGNAIICEYIKQNSFEDSLYPNSNNTLRIVCAKKKDEEKARIIKAVQRIGTDFCKPVDNVSAGGLSSEIDIETGKLGKAIAKYGDMDKRLIPYSNHPDTNALIEGKIIPNWENLKKQILDLTNRFPYFNFIAWDVSLTNDGPCVIEGNASSGCGLFQLVHGVKNEELGDIYRSYGIIK